MPRDKQLHFLAGMAIGFVSCFIWNVYAAIFFAAVIGTGKELYDNYSYGVFDAYDLMWTIAGGFAGGVICWLFLQFTFLNDVRNMVVRYAYL